MKILLSLLIIPFLLPAHSFVYVAEKPILEEVQEKSAVHTITAYTLSEDETDSTPCLGAWNDNLCELQKEIQICATRAYPRGTVLKIGELECVVLDKTARKYANRIDILMPSKEQAFEFGKQLVSVNY